MGASSSSSSRTVLPALVPDRTIRSGQTAQIGRSETHREPPYRCFLPDLTGFDGIRLRRTQSSTCPPGPDRPVLASRGNQLRQKRISATAAPPVAGLTRPRDRIIWLAHYTGMRGDWECSLGPHIRNEAPHGDASQGIGSTEQCSLRTPYGCGFSPCTGPSCLSPPRLHG